MILLINKGGGGHFSDHFSEEIQTDTGTCRKRSSRGNGCRQGHPLRQRKRRQIMSAHSFHSFFCFWERFLFSPVFTGQRLSAPVLSPSFGDPDGGHEDDQHGEDLQSAGQHIEHEDILGDGQEGIIVARCTYRVQTGPVRVRRALRGPPRAGVRRGARCGVRGQYPWSQIVRRPY